MSSYTWHTHYMTNSTPHSKKRADRNIEQLAALVLQGHRPAKRLAQAISAYNAGRYDYASGIACRAIYGD